MMTSLAVTRRTAAAALLVLGCTSALVAQDADRSKQPAVPPAPTFKFPKAQTHALPNGLRVVVVEDHSLPLVAMRVAVGVDSTADPMGKYGLYAVMMGALREGTTTKTGDQLAEAFADIGSTVRPDSSTTVVASQFPRALALLSDMLTHPRFDQASIDRRKVVQAALARQRATLPQTAPRHMLYALLLGADDGIPRAIAPSESEVTGITRDDVVGFYDEHIAPQSTTVIITGDVTDRVAVAEARRAFGDWGKGGHSAPAPAGAGSPAPRATTIYLSDRPGTQTFIYIGALGPSRNAPDAAAAEAMTAIVSARMIKVLREQRSFIYGGLAGITWMPLPRPSLVIGSVLVDAVKVDSALVDWLSLLRGLRSDKPATPQELDAVRRLSIGALPASIDGPELVAARVAEMVRGRLPLDYLTGYAAGLAALAPGDVVAAASKYIDPDHLMIVVAGDRKVIEPALKAANVAPILIVDETGRER